MMYLKKFCLILVAIIIITLTDEKKIQSKMVLVKWLVCKFTEKVSSGSKSILCWKVLNSYEEEKEEGK